MEKGEYEAYSGIGILLGLRAATLLRGKSERDSGGRTVAERQGGT